ncbi:hypothetical protein BSKO_08901 [Bryopsis sp. KO-2023]|nr:hypothetical protein BSKO_08901 [Bryopsis sp. KO-2023]
MSDWDDDDFEAEALGTVGEQTLAEQKLKQFEDEEEEEEQPKYVAKPSEPRKAKKPAYEDKGAVVDDVPLDDPELEKLRQARMQEEADFQNTLDTFGDDVGAKLDKLIPKSDKDFEELAHLLVQRYVHPHKKSKHFKSFLKHLVKQSCESLAGQEIKDVESSLASVRVAKLKQEKVEKENAAKKGKKVTLNTGKSMSAGLDDLIYEDDGDEDFDFM